MSKIIIMNTGGTISMAADQASGAVRSQEQHPLQHILPHLGSYGIEMVDVLGLPSPHITPEHMLQLAQKIKITLEQEDIQGVVVTHGTDTLEETAYFLDLVIDTQKTIVVTGAMKSSNVLGADGPANLVAAIRVVAHPESGNRGVLVVLNDEIHEARYVTKTHTSNLSTFQSPQYGPVGLLTTKKVHFLGHPLPRTYYPVEKITSHIPLIKVVSGMRPDWLSYLLHQDVDGLVIEAFGAGNVPPSIVPVLQEFLNIKKPVVLVSRSIHGFVDDLYDYEGGGHQLSQMGIIFAEGLNGPKARLKLMVVLESTRDLSTLKQWFTL